MHPLIESYVVSLMQTSFAPPTDSLYKFIAIGGMLLTAFCLLYPLYRSDQISISRIEHKRDSDLSEIQRGGKLVPYPPEAGISSAGIPSHRDDFIMQPAADFSKNAAAKDEEIINEAFKENVTEVELSRYAAEAGLCDIGSKVGAFLTAAGFLLWYFKVQRYLDYSLKQDARDKGYKGLLG